MSRWRKADLHLHSALSPCASNEMTPQNIVNMACLIGLNVLAITDHQAADNVSAVAPLAKKAGLILVPGMEVQTKEEVHLLCYFPTLAALRDFANVIDGSLDSSRVQSRAFGDQLIMSSDDIILGQKDVLLLQSSSLSLEQVFEEAVDHGGCVVPAHVDRSAFSVLSHLGFLPDEPPIRTVEYSMAFYLNQLKSSTPPVGAMQVTSSDAHSLQQMVTFGHSLIHWSLESAEEICYALQVGAAHLIRTFSVDSFTQGV